MTLWHTTVLPALLQLEQKLYAKCVFVVQDTCLLAPGVYYQHVDLATKQWPASLFGYGMYEMQGASLSWHGTKGLCVTANWWHQMNIVFENLRQHDFEYLDLWLKNRVERNLDPGLHLCQPLAGYGHSLSLTVRRGYVFGGVWLPAGVDASGNIEEPTLAGSPPEVREWVLRCRQQNPNNS